MLRERSIPVSRIGHQWRFFKEDIDEWIRFQRLDPRMQVLVVDPDPAVKDLLAEALPQRSFELLMVDSTHEVLAAASEHQFRLAFLMLSRESAETFRRLRTIDTDIHVIVTAGTPGRKLLDQMTEIGAFTLVKWPLSSEGVGDVFASLLVSRGVAAQLHHDLD